MAELLVLAKPGYTNPDAEKDRQGCYKKGDIVYVGEDGTLSAGGAFVLVKIPGIARSQVESYRDNWSIEPAFSVVSSDTTTDTFTITVSNSLPGSANQAGLTQAMVENFLTNWGATVQGFAQNQVTFTINVYDALVSQGFWDTDLTGAAFSEQSYDSGTGLHTILQKGIGWQFSYRNLFKWMGRIYH